jgi:hypothetical protein
MFLDTKDPNMTDIGACHTSLQPEMTGLSYRWLKTVLERGMTDNGDCTVLLGNECAQAMRKQLIQEVAMGPVRTGKWAGMNTTVPLECSGIGRTTTNRCKYCSS